MIHDHCHACGIKRPMLLGYLLASGASMPVCDVCMAEILEEYGHDDGVWYQLFAMDVHGYYGRVYPYDGLVADLTASYRPEAYLSN